MKATPPSLSMGTPVTTSMTTSSCVATRSHATNRLVEEEEFSPANHKQGVHVSEKDTSSWKATSNTKKSIQPIVSIVTPTKPVSRFSTGVKSVQKVVVKPPPASLSSLSPPRTLQYYASSHQTSSVEVFPPLVPPRVESTCLAAILIPESNVQSFRNEATSDTSSSSSNDSSSTWMQLPNRSDWALLVQDMAILMALDVLRVFLVQGTLQVFLKRCVLRALTSWQRRPVECLLTTHTPPLKPPPTNDFTVRGLRNYGQSCFMNSVLQALTCMDPFLLYLERIVQLQSVASGKKMCLSHVLWNLLQSLQHASMPLVDPRIVLHHVAKHAKQFQPKRGSHLGGEQQDAQEFLQALLGVVIHDAQLDTSASCSLQSSILSSNSRDEFLSLSTFLSRMNAEQSSVHRSEASRKENGHVADKVKDSRANENEAKNEDDVDREEKKQEDFEHAGDAASTAKDNTTANGCSLSTMLDKPPVILHQELLVDTLSTDGTTILPSSSDQLTLSRSAELMLQTLSPSSPSPLSGWLGSTLQCCHCHHVRPIQNAPFLDIPIVPSSVSHYLSVRGGAKYLPENRPCSLAQCLREFTSVERVQDVECRNCTLQQDMAQLEEEIFMLKGAISTIMARRKSHQGQVEGLQSELTHAETKLAILKQVDPDDGNDNLHDFTANMDDIDFGVEARKPKMKRGTAKKCLLFTRLPNILCLHVQRRYYDRTTGRMAKTRQHIDFPELLDMSPYCAYGGGKQGMPSWVGRGAGSFKSDPDANSRNNLYRCMSVIEHCGNAFGGHYQTYRRVRGGSAEEWVLVSDQSVTPIHWNDVRRCQAYMLFYEAL